MNIDNNLLQQVIAVATAAGDKIMSIYNRKGDFNITLKPDHSPLTEADLAANRTIINGLSTIDANTPILTEETGGPNFSVRRHWTCYWLVDPLDGTKEFINRNDEFTVNIALIQSGVPILGVVYVPVTGVIYTGLQGHGAYKVVQGARGETQPIAVRSLKNRIDNGLPIDIVTSHHHGTAEVDALCMLIEQHLAPIKKRSMGSSLKICLVAEGQADLYPRFGLTSEWDTAAAQAIVEAAGGHVVDHDLKPLRYNQKENMLNPPFYVMGDEIEHWQKHLSS